MIFPRTCRLCGRRSREVEKRYVPITEYLLWRSGWQCADHEACNLRRGIKPYVPSGKLTNDTQVFSNE